MTTPRRLFVPGPAGGPPGTSGWRHGAQRRAVTAARAAAATFHRRAPDGWKIAPDRLQALNRYALGAGPPVVDAPMSLGYRMRVDLRSASEWYAYYSGDYDNRSVVAFQHLLRRRGAIAVDAGANVGFWTVPLAQRAAQLGGYVIAAEPVPANRARLAENIALNRLEDHVSILDAALTDQPGDVIIALRDDSQFEAPTGNAAVLIDDGQDDRLRKVKADGVRLDDVLRERGWPVVDVIKADIEGHEDRFLAGAAETLERFRPVVLIEWNTLYFERRGIDASTAIGAVIGPLRYSCLRRGPDGWAPQSSVFSPKAIDDLVLVPIERQGAVASLLETTAGPGHDDRAGLAPGTPTQTWAMRLEVRSTEPEPGPRMGVVIITHNGRARIGRTLSALTALPEQPHVVVVDNASTDGTVERVRRDFPDVTVLELAGNIGAAARNIGVAHVDSPYVAFAEDDSWYEPGALRHAAQVLDMHPDIALINAHVLVGENRSEEPLHQDMIDTPVPDDTDLPGHRILSFLEGVSVVRRSAFEGVGGFDPRLFIGGPEEHLAADLLAAGWELRYIPAVVARHVPDHHQPSALVRRMGVRNTLWFAWSRRPLRPALHWTAHVLRSSPVNAATARGLRDALAGLPRILRTRRPLPPYVEAQMALLDQPKMRSAARRYGR